jgi:hypothetical protein
LQLKTLILGTKMSVCIDSLSFQFPPNAHSTYSFPSSIKYFKIIKAHPLRPFEFICQLAFTDQKIYMISLFYQEVYPLQSELPLLKELKVHDMQYFRECSSSQTVFEIFQSIITNQRIV